MKITIIGTGNMARGIGTRLRAAHHEIVFHSRNLKEAQEEMSTASALSEMPIEAFGSPTSEVVILAVPYGGPIREIAATYGHTLAGKIVIDITNPMDFDTLELLPLEASGAEATSMLFPEAHLVKAFNTTFATVLAAGSKVGGLPLDVYLAGDDQEAKRTVAEIVYSMDMRPLDCGNLAEARYLEGFEAIHLRLQTQLGNTWNTAIKIVG